MAVSIEREAATLFENAAESLKHYPIEHAKGTTSSNSHKDYTIFRRYYPRSFVYSQLEELEKPERPEVRLRDTAVLGDRQSVGSMLCNANEVKIKVPEDIVAKKTQNFIKYDENGAKSESLSFEKPSARDCKSMIKRFQDLKRNRLGDIDVALHIYPNVLDIGRTTLNFRNISLNQAAKGNPNARKNLITRGPPQYFELFCLEKQATKEARSSPQTYRPLSTKQCILGIIFVMSLLAQSSAATPNYGAMVRPAPGAIASISGLVVVPWRNDPSIPIGLFWTVFVIGSLALYVHISMQAGRFVDRKKYHLYTIITSKALIGLSISETKSLSESIITYGILAYALGSYIVSCLMQERRRERDLEEGRPYTQAENNVSETNDSIIGDDTGDLGLLRVNDSS